VTLGRWYFELRYLFTHPPWDTGVTPPEVVEQIESGDLEPGRALDLGCGTGTNCIYLAQYGWQASGVDISSLAVWQARRKARRAGVDCTFHQTDVTALDFLTEPFDLALDIGCLHSIPPSSRERYASGVVRLVRSGGLYMLYAFTPRSQRIGIHPEQVRQLFDTTFALERQEGGEDPTGPSSAWYWLRRL
jgi:cyclopropane fatty-acyl-phospholipid synthase-like methyltransferase